MEFLNWAVDHPLLFTMVLIAAVGIAGGLGGGHCK